MHEYALVMYESIKFTALVSILSYFKTSRFESLPQLASFYVDLFA